MTALNTTMPATTERPAPSAPGLVVHALYDLTAYTGTPAHLRYASAGDDEEVVQAALRDMPEATVTFFELPEGQPLFDYDV